VYLEEKGEEGEEQDSQTVTSEEPVTNLSTASVAPRGVWIVTAGEKEARHNHQRRKGAILK